MTDARRLVVVEDTFKCLETASLGDQLLYLRTDCILDCVEGNLFLHIVRSGTDGSSTACPVYLPDAVYINKTLITRACVVHDYQEIGAMASHESENLTENPKQPVVEPIRHIH